MLLQRKNLNLFKFYPTREFSLIVNEARAVCEYFTRQNKVCWVLIYKDIHSFPWVFNCHNKNVVALNFIFIMNALNVHFFPRLGRAFSPTIDDYVPGATLVTPNINLRVSFSGRGEPNFRTIDYLTLKTLRSTDERNLKAILEVARIYFAWLLFNCR